LPGNRNAAGTGRGLRRFGACGILAAGILADRKARERRWNLDQAARMPPVPGFRGQWPPGYPEKWKPLIRNSLSFSSK